MSPIDPLPGTRIREARLRRGLTQRQLAGERYTASYVSALEKGLTRASMASLEYLAGRLGLPVSYFVSDEQPLWERLRADLLLASEDWQSAADAYTTILDGLLPETERALALRGRAEALCRLRRPREAIGDAAGAHRILADAGATVDAAYAAYWLAYGHYLADSFSEARQLVTQLLGEVRAGLSVQAGFRLRLLVVLANIEGAEGQHARALALLDEARALAGDLHPRRQAAFHFSVALKQADAGDHEAALRAGRQALALYGATSSDRDLASLRNTMALAHAELGHVPRARRMAGEAMRDAEALGDQRLRAHVLDTQARVELAAGQAAESVSRASAAVEQARAIDYPRAEADALLTRARAHAAGGEDAAAETDFAAAAAILRARGPHALLRTVLREWSALLVTRQRHQEAVELLSEAVLDERPLQGAASGAAE